MLKNCLPFQGFVICGDEVGLPLLSPLCLWQGEGHTSTLSFELSPSAPMLGIQAFLNITNSAHTWACQTFQGVTHAASNVFSLLYLFWPFWIAQLNLALALKARRLQHFSISNTFTCCSKWSALISSIESTPLCVTQSPSDILCQSNFALQFHSFT